MRLVPRTKRASTVLFLDHGTVLAVLAVEGHPSHSTIPLALVPHPQHVAMSGA